MSNYYENKSQQIILGIFVISWASALAFAKIDDITLIGTINAHETSSKSIHVQEGNAIIDVTTAHEYDRIDCQFMTHGDVIIEQKNVNKCSFQPRFAVEHNFKMNIVNLTDKRVDYKIWIREKE